MMYKKLFVIISILMGTYSLSGQMIELPNEEIEELTDGTGDYWDPSDRKLFDMFRAWSDKPINHNEQLKRNSLFVRLDDKQKKIAFLKNLGKNKRAAEVQAEAAKKNRQIIQLFKENYPWDSYYFYYASDARALFVSQDYSVLYSDIAVPAENVDIAQFAYVLHFKDYFWGKAYQLHIWDKEKVYQLKGRKYRYSWGLFNPANKARSLQKFYKRLKKYNF